MNTSQLKNADEILSPSWKYFTSLPIRSIYKYLESIGIYNEYDTPPELNPDIIPEWKYIYNKNYKDATP